ncbi:hypothetical protein HQ447_00190 [bacterium]|nr:hypothetical protein [bacterium]
MFGCSQPPSGIITAHNEGHHGEPDADDGFDRAIIGGDSLLTAGTEIAADEATRAFLISPPFSRWKGSRSYWRG